MKIGDRNGTLPCKMISAGHRAGAQYELGWGEMGHTTGTFSFFLHR